MILACSDQQIFTGGAYAITLRYWRGCDISAYHYNVVSNMLLLSCATHLMSISLCSHYWRYPWISWIRVTIMTGLFIVTGLLLSNQGSLNGSAYFPTDIPAKDDPTALLFLPAACFQTNNTELIGMLQKSFDGGAKHFGVDVIAGSTPEKRIRGWNLFILIMLFYAVALIVQIFRFAQPNLAKRFGWQPPDRLKLRRPKSFPFVKWLVLLFGLYQWCGVMLSFAVVALCARYIMQLRVWVSHSGWLQLENGKNPENDPTSFGQLVPIFLTALILFAFIDTANGESRIYPTTRVFLSRACN